MRVFTAAETVRIGTVGDAGDHEPDTTGRDGTVAERDRCPSGDAGACRIETGGR